MATRCDIPSGGGAHPTSDTAGSGGTHHADVLAMTMENSGGTYPAAVTGDAIVVGKLYLVVAAGSDDINLRMTPAAGEAEMDITVTVE